jgi:VWFA-related protein
MLKPTAILLLAILISFNPSLILRAQDKKDDKDQTIRLKSDLVQVRAVVTDKRGQLIGDLKKEDFELLENTRPQNISFFSVEKIDSEAPGAVKPGEPTSLRAHHEAPARTIVLFVDTVHITFENLARAKQALKRFVDEQMTDRDMVALVTSSGALGLMEQFTRDRQMIRAAIDRLTLWRVSLQTLFTPYLAAQIIKGDAQALAVGTEIVTQEEHLDGMTQGYVRGKANQVLGESAYLRKVTLSTLRGVVARIAEMPGQRMIALFSEGFTLSDSGGGYETTDLQSVTSRAVRSGVVIYSIAAQGLQVNMVPASLPGIVEGRQGFRGQRGSGIARPVLTDYMAGAERDLQNGLNALAKDTGGDAFFNTNDFNGRLQKALDDNRIYYTLGYYPPDDKTTEKEKAFRRISVRVKDHPDYKVRTQRGYQPIEAQAQAQAATPRQKLVQAMSEPLPTTTIPVALSADYFEREGNDERVELRVYIDASAIKYIEQEQHNTFDLEVAMAIYDLRGQRVNLLTKEAHGDFASDRLAMAKREGFRYVERVALKPGVYQVRAGVLESATERIGTATAWVEVPDLGKGKLALSAIILNRTADANPAAKSNTDANADSMSPAVTQGIRVYKRGEVLGYDLMVYPTFSKAFNKNEQTNDDLLMQTQFIQSGDQLVFQSQWRAVTSRAVQNDKKGIHVSEQFKLNSLKPGIYELRITVKDSKSKKPVERSVLFAVEP